VWSSEFKTLNNCADVLQVLTEEYFDMSSSYVLRKYLDEINDRDFAWMKFRWRLCRWFCSNRKIIAGIIPEQSRLVPMSLDISVK
jgi:hypothetical protein